MCVPVANINYNVRAFYVIKETLIVGGKGQWKSICRSRCYFWIYDNSMSAVWLLKHCWSIDPTLLSLYKAKVIHQFVDNDNNPKETSL